MRGVKWGLIVMLVLLVLMATVLFALGLPQKASGIAAKSVCSAAFVAGRGTPGRRG